MILISISGLQSFFLTVFYLQAYVNGISLCIDGGRILVANGQQ
jgi:hypothetical protein